MTLNCAHSRSWAGTAFYDFEQSPFQYLMWSSNNDRLWQINGGNPGGFLGLLYPQNGLMAAVALPIVDQGGIVASFVFEADLRIGNGASASSGNGFSVNFLRDTDPALQYVSYSPYYAGGRMESGGTTGVAVSFDTSSGDLLPDGPDIEGIIVRVDNVTVNRTSMAARNGSCDDIASLQTGPRNEEFWAAGGDPTSSASWSNLCWKRLRIELDLAGRLSVAWKGRVLLDRFQTTWDPSPGRFLLAGRGGENQNVHFDNVRLTTSFPEKPTVQSPSGGACDFSIAVVDSGTVVPIPETIVLKLNGVATIPSLSKSGSVTTLFVDSAPGSPLPAGSTNTVEIDFTDSNGNSTSLAKSFVVPAYPIFPASSATEYDDESSGFSVRVHQMEMRRGPGDLNWIRNLEQQLGGGYYIGAGTPAPNVAQPSGTPDNRHTTQTVNWNENAPTARGFFSSLSVPPIEDAPVPGIPGLSDSFDHFAAEVLTYLSLTKGCHAFAVNSDDGFTARLGHGIDGAVLGFYDGGRGSGPATEFHVYVEQDGVYPIRLSWSEGFGGSQLEFFTIDSSGTRHLVNHRADPMAVRSFSKGRTAGFLETLDPYPDFQGAEPSQQITAVFRNDLTNVDPESIALKVDGQPAELEISTANSRTTARTTRSESWAFSSFHQVQLTYSIGGAPKTNSFSFHVRTPRLADFPSGFSVESEHFDFDGGLSKPVISTMPYTGAEYENLGAVHNVDYYQPDSVLDGQVYRENEFPNVPMLQAITPNTLDVQRTGFEVTTNYRIGWAGGGEWYNYTRTVPPGNYKIVTAMSHGDPFGTPNRLVVSFGLVIAGRGAVSQTVHNVGTHSAPATGMWNADALSIIQKDGRDAVIKLGGEHTLRMTVHLGDPNFFALVPTTEPANPPGLIAFSPANGVATLSDLEIELADLTSEHQIDLSSIRLFFNGQDATARSVITDTVAGAAVRCTPPRGPIEWQLVFRDSSGTERLASGDFLSIGRPAFVIEAEDFDFGGGQTIAAASTMPLQSGMYADTPPPVHGVDYFLWFGGPFYDSYRTNEHPNVAIQAGTDLDRGSFKLNSNHFLTSGQNDWFNYTRTFPAGNYRVYAALSSPANPLRGALQMLNADGSIQSLGAFEDKVPTGKSGINRLVPLQSSPNPFVHLAGTRTLRFLTFSADLDYLLFVPDLSVSVVVSVATFGGAPVTEGDRIVFSANPQNDTPLSWQWFRNNLPIPGANSAQYVIPNVRHADAGDYWVDVSFQSGPVRSAPATLGVASAGPYSEVSDGQDGRSLLVALDGKILFLWLPEPSAQSYVVKRALSEAGPYTVVASNVGTNAWEDTALVHHQTYFYTVAGNTPSGLGPDSPPASIRAIKKAPPAPLALRAEVGTNKVMLSWREARGAAGYAIKRANSANGPFVTTDRWVKETNFVDYDVVPGQLCFYAVTALNLSGESTNSPVAAARVLPVAPQSDPAMDLDGDGFTALEETLLSCDAADSESGLRFSSAEAHGAGFRLKFCAIPGREYTIESNDNFPWGSWDEAARLTAAQAFEQFEDSDSAASPRRMYRVRASDYTPAKPSEPAGFVRASILANSDTLLSLPFIRPPAFVGRIASVEPNRVRFSPASDWAEGKFVHAAESQTNIFFLLLRSGARAGQWHTIIASDTDSVALELDGESLDGVAPGDVAAIVPHWTLGSVFPSGAGVHPSERPGRRTTEILYPNLKNTALNPSAAATYFFMNGAWRMVGGGLTNQNHAIIPPGRYVVVRHNTNSATEIVLHGIAPSSPWRLSVSRRSGGAVDSQLALPNPVATSLNESGLFESGAFRSSASPGRRIDELFVFNNATAYFNKSAAATYYHWSGAWRKIGAGTADVGDDKIFQPGVGVIIRSSPATDLAEWQTLPGF